MTVTQRLVESQGVRAMFIINTAVIFAFGLVIVGIVCLGVMQARDQADQVRRVDAILGRINEKNTA